MKAKHFSFLLKFRKGQGAKGGFDLAEDDIPSEVSNLPGVYVIESTDGYKFDYPKGRSKVLYIGMSKDLRRRFQEHKKTLNKLIKNSEFGIEQRWVIHSRYQYMLYHGARIYYYNCRGKQYPKKMESNILWNFYEKYRALPVGNGACSFDVPPLEDDTYYDE